MWCIPTKTLVASAQAIHTVRRGEEFGFHITDLQPDWPLTVERKNAGVARIRGGGERRFAGDDGPTLIRGWARFESNTHLSVNGQAIEARKITVATGVAPVIPDLPGLREAGYLTNEHVMDLPDLPESLIIPGLGRHASPRWHDRPDS